MQSNACSPKFMRGRCILTSEIDHASQIKEAAMCRIVIVEDDAATRDMLRVGLTEEGYAAIMLNGPGDLLAQLTAATPDLVLLDLMLGAWGDGLALATAIREDPLLRHLPIIVLSAARDMLRQHADELTHLHCHMLDKPFDLDGLFALIAGELPRAGRQAVVLGM
jgi:DNA-binding response OmpR family regulator